MPDLLSQDNTQTKRFRQLLGEIKGEIESLKTQINSLQQENEQLQTELNKVQKKETDIFSPLKETERMAFKHQVKGLIAKIDEHLEGSA
jgi:regulator of replication initiation timing